MIHFITKYAVYKTWDFLAEMIMNKQNAKSAIYSFLHMIAWSDIRRRLTQNHQKRKTRKTPGEHRKPETGKIETLALAEIAYSRIVKFII